MGCIYGCILHCLKRCGCCICDCCYGRNKLDKAFCTIHETDSGKTVFNDPFKLILYDKWAKQSEVYLQREDIFAEIAPLVINRNVDTERLIIDMGCGTGAWTESLCKTFMSGRYGKVKCLDVSPQCLHFVRTRVVKRMDPGSSELDLTKFQFEYFNNDPGNLCLESANYGRNDIDIIFMAFVLNHISAPKGDRHTIMQELFKVCRPGGHLILFEHGSEFMEQFQKGQGNEAGGTGNEDHDVELLAGTDNKENETYGFDSAGELQRFMEGYGFDCVERVMEEKFGDRYWILVFEKPNSSRNNTMTSTRSQTNSLVAKE